MRMAGRPQLKFHTPGYPYSRLTGPHLPGNFAPQRVIAALIHHGIKTIQDFDFLLHERQWHLPSVKVGELQSQRWV
jgi:hypothetical protein